MLDHEATPPRHSAGSQLAILLLLTGGGIVAGAFIIAFIGMIYLQVPFEKYAEAIINTTDARLLRLLQCISAFLSMALPAIIFGLIMSRKPLQYVGFNKAISLKQVLLVIIILLMAFMLSGALSHVNEMIPISKNAETYFKKLEETYQKQVMGIANMKTWQDYAASIFIIALLPAFFEEMLFRGAFQPVMVTLTKSAFAGILITSILFSAIHFSYYGFLSRVALGFIIGYVFYYSKNLWLASIMHFLYNAIGVTQLYLLSRKGLLTPQAMNEDPLPVYYGLLAAGAVYVLFIYFRKESEVAISVYDRRKNNP